MVTDRNRGAAFLAVLIAGAGMFGVFLFLTYWLQQNLHYSPVVSGVAFLPLIALVMVVAATCPTWSAAPASAPAAGRRRDAAGRGQPGAADPPRRALELRSRRAGPLLVIGLGMGLIFAPSMNTGDVRGGAAGRGRRLRHASTRQQVGGSIGTSLLNTIFAGAVAGLPRPAT